jgi:hypothetical protein
MLLLPSSGDFAIFTVPPYLAPKLWIGDYLNSLVCSLLLLSLFVLLKKLAV